MTPLLLLGLLPFVGCGNSADSTPANQPPASAAPVSNEAVAPGVAAPAAPAAPLAAITRGPCKGFYPADFVFAEGARAKPVPNLPKPARGVALRDPNYGSCLVRISDRAKDAPETPLLRNDYSRRQAFNADDTRTFAFSADGYWHLYDADTTAYLGKLPGVVSEAEPQWHPTDPNLLWYLPVNGGMSIEQLDIRSGKSTRVADFNGKLPAWAATAAHVRTRAEGSPSRDGRLWGFQIEDEAFAMLGYMVWDQVEQKLVGSLQMGVRPDHVSMSPSGRWFVSSGFDGTWAWSPDFSRKKKLNNTTEHSDIAIAKDAHDIYVSIDYEVRGGDVFMVDIDACPGVEAAVTDAPLCPRTNLFPTYVSGSKTALHISGKAYDKPGWVVVSPYGTQPMRNGQLPWFADKIFALELSEKARVIELADHRSIWDPKTTSYWFEPQATVNRDFTRIAFTSSWGTNAEADLEAWMIQLPSGAIR